ncbi:hypothetical protein ACHHYP_02162 [Achlya hypogyna]|uniref:SUN domain-containing protein n=1 Tax=Achlya hypogyna TaxID=1202772 RepID=A0A1V9ZSE2_ACHHY|nr:hypothetical protein ACHHYP_02162 [Achlya hypogyna]
MHRGTPRSRTLHGTPRDGGSPGFATPPLMYRQRTVSQDSEPPFQRTLFRDDMSGTYRSIHYDGSDDDDFGEEDDLDDEEEDDTPVYRPLPKRKGWLRFHFTKRAIWTRVSGIMGYLWLCLPFVCLIIAFAYPQYLISVIQSSPGSLTSQGHSQAQTIASIQVHLNAMINDMEMLKKRHRDHDAKMDELLFLHEQTAQTVERMAGGERTADYSIDNSPSSHVENLIDAAVKKAQRDLSAEVSAMLAPLEVSIAQLSQQTSVLESNVHDQSTRLQKTIEVAAHQSVDNEVDARIQTQVEHDMARLRTDLDAWVQDETSRMAAKVQDHVVTEVRARLAEGQGARGNNSDCSSPAPQRFDHANIANGASIARDFTGPMWGFFYDRLFAEPAYTSPSYSIFPLCSLLGGRCPLKESHPETAISACSSGKLTIKFSQPTMANTVVIYHPSRDEGVYWRSAPNAFKVTGHALDHDTQEVTSTELGYFEYKDDMKTQEFLLRPEVYLFSTDLVPCSAAATPILGLTLDVMSNHGSTNYTCIYRVRVFGKKTLN